MTDTYCRVHGSGGHRWTQTLPSRTVTTKNEYGHDGGAVVTAVVQSCECGELRVRQVPLADHV